jgi:hypothetical protein
MSISKFRNEKARERKKSMPKLVRMLVLAASLAASVTQAGANTLPENIDGIVEALKSQFDSLGFAFVNRDQGLASKSREFTAFVFDQYLEAGRDYLAVAVAVRGAGSLSLAAETKSGFASLDAKGYDAPDYRIYVAKFQGGGENTSILVGTSEYTGYDVCVLLFKSRR